MKKILTALVALLAATTPCTAGGAPITLARKAGLGAKLAASPQGVALEEILPGGSAQTLGLKPGDIVTALNATPIRGPKDLLVILQPLRAGDPLSIDYVRGGKAATARGKAVGRPKEQYEGATTAYGAFSFRNARIRDILVQPVGKPEAPVIFELQGYTCASIEAPGPAEIYSGLARDFVKAGIGYYRVEKPGMGDSSGEVRCEDIDYATELDAFRTAYRHLVNDLRVSPDRIVMLGHSMGGFQAPMLAAETPPRGVAVFGIILKNWADYSVEIARYQDFVMNGRDPVEEAEQTDKAAALLRQFYLEKLTPKQIVAKEPAAAQMLRDQIAWDGGNNAFGRNISFAQQLPELPITRSWRDTKSRVLSLYGTSDAVAMFGTDQEMIAEVVNWYRPGTAEYVEVPDTMHIMDLVGDRHAFRARNLAAGQWVIGKYNPAVGAAITSWVHKIMAEPAVRTLTYPAPGHSG